MLPAPPARAFAERLDRLFRAAGDPSLEATARAIRAGGGPTISASYLWLLRTGRKANPTLAHLTALAGHFGVPPAYFFDDALTAATAGELEGRAALGDPAVRALALAAAGLSPRARAALAALAEQLREIEAPTRRARRRREGPTEAPARRPRASG